MVRKFAQAVVAKSIRSVSNLDWPSVDRDDLSLLGLDDLHRVLAPHWHPVKQRSPLILNRASDEHLVRQSEAEQMDATSFTYPLIMQPLGGGVGCAQRRITKRARKVILTDGKAVR